MEGTCFESDWAAVAAGLSGLRGLLDRLHQAGSERLGPMFADLAWCNRPSNPRNPERPAATAAQSDSKQVPSMTST